MLGYKAIPVLTSCRTESFIISSEVKDVEVALGGGMQAHVHRSIKEEEEQQEVQQDNISIK